MKKTVLITGASSGIGKSMANKFASKGHNLIIVARRKELLKEIRNDIEAKHSVDIIINDKDLTHEASVIELYEEIKSYEVNVLINNAGFGDYNKAWEVNGYKISAMIDLNVKALCLLSLLFVKNNKDKDAQLINVSSGLGYFTYGLAVTCSATKYFVTAFTEGIAQNLKSERKKMQVKLLAPAVTRTEFETIATKQSQHKKHDWKNAHTPDEIAGFAYQLYESDKTVGAVDRESYEFILKDPFYPYGV